MPSEIHPDFLDFVTAPKPSGVLLDLERAGRLPTVLGRMQGIPQNPEKHPEGDLWRHILLVVDHAAALAEKHGLDEPSRHILLTTALTHDLGKITTTVVSPDGKIRSWKHEDPEYFLPPYQELAAAWNLPGALEKPVTALVRTHLPNARLSGTPPTDREVRRFLRTLDEAGVPFLLARLLIGADVFGRGQGELDPLGGWEPQVEKIRAESRPAGREP